MTPKEAFDKFNTTRGITSIIVNPKTGDYSIVRNPNLSSITLEEANQNVSLYTNQLQSCTSEWDYNVISSNLKYWKSVRNILLAASLNNGQVANVEYNPKNMVVVTLVDEIEKYSIQILNETKKLINPDS